MIRRLSKYKIVAIAAGEKHAAALDEDGSVFVWGHGKDGQIGIGSNVDCRRPTLVEDLRQSNVKAKAIACMLLFRQLSSWMLCHCRANP